MSGPVQGSGGKASSHALQKARDIVVPRPGNFGLTDLTQTRFEGVQDRYFRLFQPIKFERNRFPTSLPEYRSAILTANLSDSPLYAADRLGGTWREHNLAAICHVAACNFRCPYCYVDFAHLAGRDLFEVTAAEIVDAFEALRARIGVLTIMRVSGGEPLLAPELIVGIYELLKSRGLLTSVVLKVETNLSPLGDNSSLAAVKTSERLRDLEGQVPVHATLHAPPGHTEEWALIERGLGRAMDLGLDLFPAIGGADWTELELVTLHNTLQQIHPRLPERLAVRPFQLDYEVVRARRRGGAVGESRASVEAWDAILLERSGRRYLEQPRHEVSLRR